MNEIGDVGKLVKKSEMGDPKVGKLTKKVETGDMKVEALVKKIQMSDPTVGHIGKSVSFGEEEYMKPEQDAMRGGEIHQVR